MPHRIIKTISGRKGSALVLLAFIFIPISVSQVGRPPESRGTALSWLPEWVSTDVLGWLFLGCSLTAFAIGLVSKRVPTAALAVGYGLMILPPAILAGIYLVATFLGLSPTSYVSVAIYGGYASLVWLISGWDESRPPPPWTDEQRGIVRGDVS